jgi:hypothetical protein
MERCCAGKLWHERARRRGMEMFLWTYHLQDITKLVNANFANKYLLNNTSCRAIEEAHEMDHKRNDFLNDATSDTYSTYVLL